MAGAKWACFEPGLYTVLIAGVRPRTGHLIHPCDHIVSTRKVLRKLCKDTHKTFCYSLLASVVLRGFYDQMEDAKKRALGDLQSWT